MGRSLDDTQNRYRRLVYSVHGRSGKAKGTIPLHAMAGRNGDNMHTRFKRFLVNNLCHNIADPSEDEVPLWKAYKDYSELKWNEANTLLEDPTQACDGERLANMFVRFMQDCEQQDVPWFLVSRQAGLSDSHLQRCVNQFKQRYMYVSLPENQRVDLGILEQLVQINKLQLNLRIPESRPILTMHAARMMRQMFILHQQHPQLVKYCLDSDTKQFEKILCQWFDRYYTTLGEGIGYPRRQLLEEANDMITNAFGANKLMYCHDPSWRALLRHIGVDDTQQKGSYLRLHVWKKSRDGTYLPNVRRSSGPGGDYTFDKRKGVRLASRKETKKEKDTASKKKENTNKRKRDEL